MELSPYVEGLRGELTAMTRFAGEDVARTAGLLAESLDSPVRLTLLDALSAAAAEITAQLEDTAVEVRLADGEPAFVVSSGLRHGAGQTPPPAAETGDEAATARVTLRLPESLKLAVEAAAASDGVSVNTWLARAASQALSGQPRSSSRSAGRRGPGQRITGFARS